MVDILQRVGARATSLDDAYDALTTLEGLKGWWTTDSSGDAEVDGIIRFRFGEAGGFDMRVVDQAPAKRVLWEVVDGPEEWIGTTVSWDLKQEDDFTIVLLKHEGWREPVEFMHHCTTKWASYLLSLKQLLETGTGSSFPEDVEISNWP